MLKYPVLFELAPITGKMLTNRYNGVLILLWTLFCHWKCNATITENTTWSEEVAKRPSKTVSIGVSDYMYYGSSSQLFSPTLDCCDHEAYQCRVILQHGIVKCGKRNTLSVRNGYCLTIDEKTDILEAGQCLYNYNTYDSMYYDLTREKSELNDFMCNTQVQLNRTGTLCGKCQDGYYPLAYSYDMTCVQCQNEKSNWWKFMLAAFLPLTIFCIIILFFKINVVSSRFQGFLFYSQVISMPAMIRVFLFIGKFHTESETQAIPVAIRALAAFYGFWNLDFFRSIKFGICLGTDALQTLALDFVIGIYPLLFMVASYVLIELYDRNFRPLVIMWKPFRTLFGLFRENWNLRTSLIDSFATTFLLANIKFQSVSFDLLTPVKVYQIFNTGNWTYSYRLFYDATVPYFGSRHLPYAIIAITAIVLFTIIPIFVLILYPFRSFQKFLNLFPIRWYILHTVVESFYGSYKDGTQPGTHDCRWFASLFFLSRFCLMFAGAYTNSAMYFPVATMILVLVALLFVTVQPFKYNTSHFTTINAFFVLLLALLHSCCIVVAVTASEWQPLVPLFLAMTITVVVLPLLYISAIVLHWMYRQRTFGADVIAKIRAWRNGYGVTL